MTIVVLLILAGITIATLFGDNRVINKAQKAKEETDRTAIEEQEGIQQQHIHRQQVRADIQEPKYLKQVHMIMDGEC